MFGILYWKVLRWSDKITPSWSELQSGIEGVFIPFDSNPERCNLRGIHRNGFFLVAKIRIIIETTKSYADLLHTNQNEQANEQTNEQFSSWFRYILRIIINNIYIIYYYSTTIYVCGIKKCSSVRPSVSNLSQSISYGKCRALQECLYWSLMAFTAFNIF